MAFNFSARCLSVTYTLNHQQPVNTQAIVMAVLLSIAVISCVAISTHGPPFQSMKLECVSPWLTGNL